MSEEEIWICSACGDAEGCDAQCELKVWAGEPISCPISSDLAEWFLTKRPE